MYLRNIFVIPIKIYRKYISPAFGGAKCIYTPSCSSYFEEAVLKHGILKGSILGITRILRCNRFFLGGPDPVPEKFSFSQIKDTFILMHR